MRVTPHFDSLEWSQRAGYGLPWEQYPDQWISSRLIVLCDALEELRHYLLCPIHIISGYRSQEYNDRHIAAGHTAAKNSMHIHGVAADIVCDSFKPGDVHAAIHSLISKDRIKLGGLGLYSSFIHVDVRHILPGMPQKLATWTG